MSKQITDYYHDPNLEDSRLSGDIGTIEWERTLDILKRFLPPPPQKVLDVGGGTGVYSKYLLEKGYQVHLIDLVNSHVNMARQVMGRASPQESWSARVGDARSLDYHDRFFDVVLLMGPLYHLQKKSDRIQALKECRRVLRPGGRLFCTIISRFASFLDGLGRGLIRDPGFREIISRDLRDGRHENPTRKTEYFTRAYFQHPDELGEEIRMAGFTEIHIRAVEGILWAAGDPRVLKNDEPAWKAALEFMKEIEEESSILGVSPHIMGLARKNE